jgi:hypothetical protein
MAEPKLPTRPTPPEATPDGRADAFDFWLRGALRSLFGPVVDEPIPEALRRLVNRESTSLAPREDSAGASPSCKFDTPKA